jgi:X-Pro dipeptidyl-peptidase
MQTPRSVPCAAFVAALFALPLLVAPATAQEAPTAEKAAPVFENGEAQEVPAFRSPREWVRHWLWVETEFDTDGDGKKDRMHVDVTRPGQTDSEGLKVPVVYETSPYFAGTGPMDTSYFWDAKQEVGAEPPARKPMPPIGFGKQPGMIANSEVRTWVPRGFAVVHSCSPGTGWSQGCPSIGGDNESLAPKAVIDWLCGRAKGYTTIDGDEEVKAYWSTGKVGMIGTSYNGTLPIAAATTGVEGLMAIVPIAPNTSYYHYYRSNGLVRHPGGYLGEDIDVLFDFIHSGNPQKRDYCNTQWRDGVLTKGFDRQNGDWNEFWASRDYLLDLGPMRAATLMAHAWNDWNVMPEHSVRIYAALKQKGVPCMAFFHQGGHGGAPPLSLVNRWFTRFLYDVDNGVEKDPKSWIVRENDNPRSPTPYPDYPHPEAAAVALHPTKSGNKVGALVLQKADGQGRETLVDDVEKSGSTLAAAAESPHRLLFATAPLATDLHLSGTARIALRVASNKPAANLSVWVVVLPWQASRRVTDTIITRGWADPQNHKSLERGEPLEPGRFYDLTFDLQPDDQVIQKGKQIGLMLFSSDRDFTLWPAPGTELTVDLDHVTLTLPVVGGSKAMQAALAR